MKYSEKLLDPRWQRKRLEILQRDNFTCVVCKATDKTLHVHHRFYAFGIDPWDYQDIDLVTLCCDCHDEQHILIPSEKDFILSLKIAGYDIDQIAARLKVSAITDHSEITKIFDL